MRKATGFDVIVLPLVEGHNGHVTLRPPDDVCEITADTGGDRLGVAIYNYGPGVIEAVAGSGDVLGTIVPRAGGFVPAPQSLGTVTVRVTERPMVPAVSFLEY